MKNVYIIADDTTGANSSAILHKPLGYNCVSIHGKVDTILENSVYSLSTNSRGVTKEEAYKRVEETLTMINDDDAIFNKRVDSTLRGNLGSELDAILDKFPNKRAIVVASFPNSGRTCVNNTLYVHGELLELTDVAKDPKAPVHTSIVTDLFKLQTKRKISHISLIKMRSDDFRNSLQNEYNNNEIIVVDAEKNCDIDRIADMCIELKLDVVTVDPGPFTYYYAKNYKKRQEYKFYCLVGSVTPLTISQMRYAKDNGAYVYELDVPQILGEQYQAYLDTCLTELKEIDNDFIIITTSYLERDSKLNLEVFCKPEECIEDVSNTINKRIAKLFLQFNQYSMADCVYTSGGDTTVEFLNQVDSYGLQMNSEILPLTVESSILGGPYEGLKIVSKGGLIGHEDTLVYIYNYMKVGRSNE